MSLLFVGYTLLTLYNRNFTVPRLTKRHLGTKCVVETQLNELS